MALEIVSLVLAPVTAVAKSLFDSLKLRICLVTSYTTNIENLRREMSQLKVQLVDVETSVEAAKRRMEVPFGIVIEWIRKVHELEEEIRVFEEKVNANKKCFSGICPDFNSRFKLSKEGVAKAESVNDLRRDGNFSATKVAHPQSPPRVELVRSSSTVEMIPSRVSVMKEVMAALEDDDIKSVGVHGMGGIGKTTLVNKLNNDLKGIQLFKKVIMVTVSKEPNLNIIQDNIAARLGLKLDKELPTAIRGNKLFERMKAEDSLLIILDDLWNKLDMAEIGIPVADEHMGCKVLVTTRYHEVCSQMVRKTIKMDPLYEAESWDLFKAKAGIVATSPNLLAIAQEIVRRCKGSPLAICVLGSSLKETEEEYVWKDALNVLQNPYRSGLEGIMPEVIKSLRFSYDHLQTPDIKLCFLFCCLFPEDYNIHLPELRDYGIGEGFLKMNERLEEASTRLLTFVKKLKDCCLLLDGDEDCSVKMHDIVRDVAISVASDDENGFLVNVGGGLRNFRDTDKLKGYKRISFMNNENKALSDPLECPQLRTLLIRENKKTSINDENFFEGAKSLAVLDLRGTSSLDLDHPVISVPQSLLWLTNLRSLYLMDCDVSNQVSVLGGLRKLEILKLCGSLIDKLPGEIGNLTNLMCLDLTKARLSVIAPNVISRLSNLEELLMWNNFKDWDREGSGGNSNASLLEVASLNHLNFLNIGISDETPHDMFYSWKNLKAFQVAVNLKIKDNSSSHNNCNVVYFAEVDPLRHWVHKLLAFSKVTLSLESCYEIKNVADLVAVGGLKHMEELKVEKCDDIEYIIRVEESNKDSLDSLVTVKFVTLRYLRAMKEIFRGSSPSTRSFGNLRTLIVIMCHRIKNVFSSNLLLPINRLENLEEVRVSFCDSLQEIFNIEEKEDRGTNGAVEAISSGTPTKPPMLPSKSMSLSLRNLLRMTSIWKGVVPTGCLQHLKAVDLHYCSKLEYLASYKEKGFQSIEKLHIHMCNGMRNLISSKEEDLGESTSSSLHSRALHSPTFPNLQSLRITDCVVLKNIFSFSVARDLKQLTSLSVGNCKNLQKVIANEEADEASDYQSCLPQLQSLDLWDLTSLTSFIEGNIPINCPLKQIRVARCPNLKKLPLATHITSSLQAIKAESQWFEGLEWEVEGQEVHFESFFEEITKR